MRCSVVTTMRSSLRPPHIPVRRDLEHDVQRAADHELDGQADGSIAELRFAGEHVAAGVGLEHAHDATRQRLAEAVGLGVLETQHQTRNHDVLGRRLA